MGIFDIFKKQAEQPTENEVSNAQAQTKEPYLGDLEKTAIIAQLLHTPYEARDEQWQESFLSNVVTASFRCGDPQIITGPDGMPYFQLFIPEPNKAFQCFVINHMKDDFLLDNGFGVVINPNGQQADWVFSHGDIVNLSLNNTFYTSDDDRFSKTSGNETIKEEEEVMTGQPAENLLPKRTRKIIADYLNANGVAQPKIMLMMRKNPHDGSTTQDIVFNLTPKQFPNEDTYRAIMHTLRWYLPRHYSYVGMEEQNMDRAFMPL